MSVIIAPVKQAIGNGTSTAWSGTFAILIVG
jgi:hypothetical protein